jgi:hypothetical protein
MKGGPSAKRRKTGQKECQVEPGMSGFLISCFKNREKQAITEGYSVLGSILPDNDEEINPSAAGSCALDIQDQIALQVKNMKNLKRSRVCSIPMGPLSCLGFLRIQCFCKNINFSNKDDEKEGGNTECCEKCDPCSLIYHLYETRPFSSIKYIQRLIPIQRTCYANIKDCLETVQILLKRSMDPRKNNMHTAGTFEVEYRSRFNSSLHKKTVIDMVADAANQFHLRVSLPSY